MENKKQLVVCEHCFDYWSDTPEKIGQIKTSDCGEGCCHIFVDCSHCNGLGYKVENDWKDQALAAKSELETLRAERKELMEQELVNDIVQATKFKHALDQVRSGNMVEVPNGIETEDQFFEWIHSVEQPDSADPIQHTPSDAQLDQILNGISERFASEPCREFLRVWIRDWTIHKLEKLQRISLPRPMMTDDADYKAEIVSSLKSQGYQCRVKGE